MAALALIFAVAQWSALHHEATEKHIECAEHGDRGHAASIDVERGEWNQLHRTHEHTSPDVRSGLGELEHEHEHCWIATSSRESMDRVPVTCSVAAPDVPDVVERLAEPTCAPAIAVLRMAPKTSPPV